MPTLADFASRIDSRPVTIRGRKLTARKLSIAQQDAIRRAIDLPEPPVGFDRTKGTNHGPVLNYDDPGYRRDVASRERRVTLAEACVAIDLTLGTIEKPAPVPASAQDLKAWREYCSLAWTQVGETGALVDDDVNAIHEALAGVAKDMVAEAQGN